MTTKRRTRFHSNWRVDQDYRKKLSPEELAWLEKFNDEYYRAQFDEEPLHSADAVVMVAKQFEDVPGSYKEERFQAQNAAWRDVVTQTSKEVFEATTKAAKASTRGRYNSPDDYKPSTSKDVETALVEAIDAAERAKLI